MSVKQCLPIAIGLLTIASGANASVFNDLENIAERLNTVDFHLNEYTNNTQSLDLSAFSDLFAAYETAIAHGQFPTKYTKDEQSDIVNQGQVQEYDFQLFSELVDNKATLIKAGGYGYALDHNLTTTENLDTTLRELYEATVEAEGNDDAATEIEQSAEHIAQYLETARASLN